MIDFIENAAGLTIGGTADKKLSFHGAAPVARRAGAAQAAVTPGSTNGAAAAALAIGAITILPATGADASGGAESVTCTGATVGQTVLGVLNLTDGTLASALFEEAISVVDKIQQADGDLAAKALAVLLATPSVLPAEAEHIGDDVRACVALCNELRAALVEKGIIKGAA